MGFFNKKEEVLDLQLTPFGEQLLSEGKFQPVFYAFYDDDILYDAAGASSVLETQNDIEGRIQDDTPQIKTQYVFSGVETNLGAIITFNRYFAAFNEEFRASETAIFPPLIDKDFSLVEPLGSMELGSLYSPSWELQVLQGELSGAINYLTSSANGGAGSLVKRIPQLDFDIKYDVSVGWEGDLTSAVAISRVYQDGTFLYLSEGIPEIIISVDERNASGDTEYDVEVFEVKEDPAFGTEDILVPLTFESRPPQVVDGLLVDSAVGPQPLVSTDEDMVRYYWDIQIDREIPASVLCDAIADLRLRGVDVDDIRYDCPEVVARAPVDIYGRGPSGEECNE